MIYDIWNIWNCFGCSIRDTQTRFWILKSAWNLWAHVRVLNTQYSRFLQYILVRKWVAWADSKLDVWSNMYRMHLTFGVARRTRLVCVMCSPQNCVYRLFQNIIHMSETTVQMCGSSYMCTLTTYSRCSHECNGHAVKSLKTYMLVHVSPRRRLIIRLHETCPQTQAIWTTLGTCQSLTAWRWFRSL